MAPRQKNGYSQPASSGTSGGTRQSALPSHKAKPAASSVSSSNPVRYSQLDFNALNIQVLRKYRQVFKLNVKARSSKEELVMAATRHFSSHMVDEVDTIARFLYTVHSSKSPADYC